MGALEKWTLAKKSGAVDELVFRLYGEEMSRLRELAIAFDEKYPDADDVFFFRAPGRLEIGGNHTDHQRGCVLAAAISQDAIGAASSHADGVIRIFSEGFSFDEIDVSHLSPMESEFGSSAGLIRGVAAGFLEKGYQPTGFDAYISSEVLPGSGLSSSAAFTVLLANMMNHFYAQGQESGTSLATICSKAENRFYGKPSGLMDQMASSLGGIVAMDFGDQKEPKVRTITCDFDEVGYDVLVVETGADHAGLTEEYAKIPNEMRSVAEYFGADVLREIAPDLFARNIPEIRAKVGDRAVLRAMHFFNEQERVLDEAQALEEGDIARFLTLVNESGDSSWRYLQNVYVSRDPAHQEPAVVLAVCRRLLKNRGACRIHGGGFGGTVLVFVEREHSSALVQGLETVFGEGCCQPVQIVDAGGMLLF